MNKPKPTPGHIRLHGIVEQLASAYRGYLPDELKTGDFTSRNPKIPADVRTRLAFIEDCIDKADKAVDDPLLVAAPEMFDFINGFDGSDFGTEEAHDRWYRLLKKAGGRP